MKAREAGSGYSGKHTGECAIGRSLFEPLQFDNGRRVLNPKFSSYRLPRFSDVPHIDVVLVDRRDIPPAGAGETPIVGLAPAVANAIFNATGVRLGSATDGAERTFNIVAQHNEYYLCKEAVPTRHFGRLEKC
jgi:hypothetical protein